MGPHSSSDDPELYRSSDAVEEWRDRDPIVRMRRHLEHLGIMDSALDERLGHEIDSEVRAAITVAEAKARPERDTLFDDVYAERTWNLVEQAAELEGVSGKGGA
jgi:pyruvate dehydrogenase E1 component alpha subunit/2-oxoisovalerate dehydrogenase E1 component alpha subunit